MATLRVNPWAREHHVLRTSLSPAECRERLDARTAPVHSRGAFFGTWLTASDHPVRGHVGRDRFHLLKMIRGRNSWQSDAWGRFTAVPDGTRIDLSLGQNLPIAVFEACVLGALLLFLLAVLLSGRSFTDGLVILAILAMGVIMHAAGRWGAGKDQEFLVQHVRETLDAEEEPTAATR